MTDTNEFFFDPGMDNLLQNQFLSSHSSSVFPTGNTLTPSSQKYLMKKRKSSLGEPIRIKAAGGMPTTPSRGPSLSSTTNNNLMTPTRKGMVNTKIMMPFRSPFRMPQQQQQKQLEEEEEIEGGYDGNYQEGDKENETSYQRNQCYTTTTTTLPLSASKVKTTGAMGGNLTRTITPMKRQQPFPNFSQQEAKTTITTTTLNSTSSIIQTSNPSTIRTTAALTSLGSVGTIPYDPSRTWKVSDFTFGKPLGKGKFGNVYYAKQKSTNHPIALKVLFKSQINNEIIFKMLKREIEIQYRLKHESINQLYSYFHDQKSIYLILEYAEHGEFYKYLSKNRYNISELDCSIFILQITQALEYMHSRHVYHRDIKPENILITSTPSHSTSTSSIQSSSSSSSMKHRLLLADFGSAVHAPPPNHNIRYTVCGTPEYLAPEMILASGHDSSLDMWALGILMYEILYGR